MRPVRSSTAPTGRSSCSSRPTRKRSTRLEPPSAAPQPTSPSPRSAPTASRTPGPPPPRPDRPLHRVAPRSSTADLRGGDPTPVIEIEGLRKEYRRLQGGRTLAVDGLDLSVPQGGVFGFLGPNGAGKTTTIRCLLGLVRPTGGACRLLGADTGS